MCLLFGNLLGELDVFSVSVDDAVWSVCKRSGKLKWLDKSMGKYHHSPLCHLSSLDFAAVAWSCWDIHAENTSRKIFAVDEFPVERVPLVSDLHRWHILNATPSIFWAHFCQRNRTKINWENFVYSNEASRRRLDIWTNVYCALKLTWLNYNTVVAPIPPEIHTDQWVLFLQMKIRERE